MAQKFCMASSKSLNEDFRADRIVDCATDSTCTSCRIYLSKSKSKMMLVSKKAFFIKDAFR